MLTPGASRLSCNIPSDSHCNCFHTQINSGVRLRAVCAQAASSKSSRTGRPRPQPLSEQIITPVKPSTGSGPLISLEELDSINSRTGGQQRPAGKQQQQQQQPQQKKNTKHDSRRGALVNIRVAPRRYRLRKSFDQPRNIHVSPTDPTFEGRLTSEINSCYGPRQLTKIIKDFGPNLTAAHCAAVISLLAGMVTGKQLTEEQLQDTFQSPAAKVADILTKKISQASMVDCARAVYGLARLQLHVPALLTAVEQHSRGQLSSATPQALAGIAAGLSHWGHKPSEQWMQELIIHSFAQMSTFGAQDLANLLFALAFWDVSVSQPFLLRCLTAFRGHWGSAGCHAPTLVRFIFAVTQLPACQPLPEGMLQTLPPSAAVYQHHDSWRQEKHLQELTQVMGLPGPPSTPPPPPAAAAAAADNSGNPSSSSSSSGSGSGSRSVKAVATYRLPSFNWLTAFLAECRRQIDLMKPAELSTLLWSMASLNHTPDLIFMESWYRACAVHMHAFRPQALATAVQAVGMLQPGSNVPGGVSGRWLQLVIQRSGEVMGSCSGSELVKVLWGLAELRVWPGQQWMDAWLAAFQQQLPTMTPNDISDTVWALARLRYNPPHPWTLNLSSAITKTLPEFTAQALAVVIWGFSSLDLKPDKRWLIAFKGLAGTQYKDDNAQKLGRFIAGVLAQQNRRRFSDVPAVRGSPVARSPPPPAAAAAAGRGGKTRGRESVNRGARQR